MTSALTELWYTRCPVPTPVGLAAQLGLLEEGFAQDGVALRSIIDSPDRDVRRSHFEHTLDFSFRHGGNVPPIRARSQGRATRLVGITWTDEFQAVIALPASGIRSVSDLAGRRFGVPRRPEGIVDFMRATALKGLVTALSLEGLDRESVELVDLVHEESVLGDREEPSLFGLPRRLAYGLECAALLRGEVDAVFVKGTAGIAAANLIGAIAVSEFGFHPDPAVRVNSGSPRILTVDERLAEERPDLVRRLIGIVAQAGDWAAAHPQETRRFIARESHASEEQVLAANGADIHRNLGLSLRPDLLDAVGRYKDFLLEWGFIERDFDVAAWADHRPWAASARRVA